MRYEYRITSDSPEFEDVNVELGQCNYCLTYMLGRVDPRLESGASWAEVQFVRVDDDGTYEVLRRLRLD